MTSEKGADEMNERSYHLVSKDDWGTGRWQDEPDKVVWVDDDTGLDCMIVRNRSGALCGYVGVPEGHPWHGKDYDSIEPYPDVHGGLTFAAPCAEGKTENEYAICHNPQGRPDNVWWLGFDCAHAWDVCPAHNRYGDLRGPEDVYRDLGYVKRQVASLAAQAACKAGTGMPDLMLALERSLQTSEGRIGRKEV